MDFRLLNLIEHCVVALMTPVLRIGESIMMNTLSCIFLAAINMVTVITHAFRVVFSSGMLAVGDCFPLTIPFCLRGY